MITAISPVLRRILGIEGTEAETGTEIEVTGEIGVETDMVDVTEIEIKDVTMGA